MRDPAKETTQQGLELLPSEANAARINGLNVLGNLHELSGDSHSAITSWQQAMTSAKAVGDLRWEGMLWANNRCNRKSLWSIAGCDCEQAGGFGTLPCRGFPQWTDLDIKQSGGRLHPAVGL
ncbi:hypothetical protein KFU94_38225 [Chloroflexi bacterium TSY]|nr:hypothetical protein [Chloroflexi bacterium TSY]